MKKRILTLILVVCALYCLCACGTDPLQNLTLGDAILTDFTAVDLDGNIVDSSVLEGYKVTMLNVWATWCKPCKEEMPALAELNDEYGDAGFQVIGIAYDTVDKNFNKAPDAYASALQIVKDTGADYTHVVPSKSLKNIVGDIQSVPVTIFVNEQGRQIGETYLGAKSKEDWQKIIDQMLKFVNETAQ